MNTDVEGIIVTVSVAVIAGVALLRFLLGRP